jgi:hypothetical protein
MPPRWMPRMAQTYPGALKRSRRSPIVKKMPRRSEASSKRETSQGGRRGRLLPAYCLLPCLLELNCTARSFLRVQILGCFSPCLGHLKQSPTKLGRKFGSCELQTLFSIGSALRGVHRRLHSLERWFEGENDAMQARVPKLGARVPSQNRNQTAARGI